MDGLLQRVERQQPSPCLNGGLGRPCLGLMRQQLLQGFDPEIPQPLPFNAKPFLPRLLLEAQPLQQVASLEVSRLSQGLRRSLGHEPFECRRVHVHRGGV